MDNTAVQDGYQLYHHSFFFTRDGMWTVVQQGINTDNRWARCYLANEKPEKIVSEIRKMQELTLPARHQLLVKDLRPDSLAKILPKAYERQPKDFLQLLETEGVGPKTIRALALVGDLIYGAKASLRDPARYSFAHEGKDGTPFPVDKQVYDPAIATLRRILSQAKIGSLEKQKAFQRLSRFYREEGQNADNGR